jgi:spermidine synthase
LKQSVGQVSGIRELILPAAITFCVAGATILLELVQTRIYAVVFWNHLVYFIISIALLGFGISCTWLSFGDNTRLARALTLPNAAIGFILSTILSSIIVPRMGISLGSIFSERMQLCRLMVTYMTAVFPYFFAGWMLGVVYRDFARHIHFLYFADLVGAFVGCMIFLSCMQPLGAVGLVLLCCVMIATPPFLARNKSRGAIIAGCACVVMIAGMAVFRNALSVGIMPEPTKAEQNLYANLEKDDTKVLEFSEWNTLSRIDVVSTVKHPQGKRIFIDGDAWTGMRVDRPTPAPRWDPRTDHMITWAMPYLIRANPESVLVIGSGGGIDVFNALRARPQHVDAVEINPTTARIVADEYGQTTHGVFDDPRVKLYNEEGRSFVRRSAREYDVIVMNAIDTLTALNVGAYVLSENYLYTVDAMTDYILHLKANGVMSISRWGTNPEACRLFVVCLEALYRLGVPEPEKHIIAALDETTGFVGIMTSRSAFSAEDVAAIRSHSGQQKARLVYPAAESDHKPGEPQFVGFMNAYAAQRKSGDQEAYLNARPQNLSPVWDDSPFFFHFDRARNMRAVFSETTSADLVRGHWASFTLFTLLALLGLAVVVFMFLPLLSRTRVRIPLFGSWLLYFSCLGVSFIFVEIALMQRFALLLGHPSRSLALVLASLLLFAGIGSQLGLVLRINLKAALLLVIVTILAAGFAYPHIVKAVLGWPLWMRGGVTVALVAPLGFFMGMAFPAGIRRVSAHGSASVPWMYAINSGTTVLGSVLAIVIAIWVNFTMVFVLAAAGYLLALLLFVRVSRGVAPPLPTHE